jgi:hypothetical protein
LRHILTAVTLPMMVVNSVRRMMMTIKEAFQATVVGVLFAMPFIVEIIKELVK